MKTIGIVNGFGGNRGDEAMLSTLIHFLNVKFPDYEIVLYAHKWVQLDAVEVTQVISNPAIGLLRNRFVRKLFPWGGIRYIFGSAKRRRELDAIYQHDYIVSSPAGPYIGELYKSAEERKLLPLALAACRGTPFAIVSTSGGPFHDQFRNRWRRRILNAAEFWALREGISHNNVEALALESQHFLVTDLVFSMEDRALEHTMPSLTYGEFLSIVEEVKATPTILVTLNITPFMKTPAERKAFDGDAYVQKIAPLLKRVAQVSECRLMLMPHFYGELAELKLFHQLLSDPELASYTTILPSHYNHHAQAELYNHAVFALSHRYHPTIFAAKAHCPFMCIRHQFKADGMMDYLGNPGVSVDSESSLEDWTSAFERCWTDRHLIREQLTLIMPEVVSASQKSLQRLQTSIQERTRDGS